MLRSASRQTGQVRLQPSTRARTVCVVDPRPTDYHSWQALAEERGLRLIFLTTAEDALRTERTHPIDLWAVNIVLPGLSGFELCSMLRSRSPATPVYMVADEYSATTEQQAWGAHATLFGCKPAHDDWLQDWLDLKSIRTPRNLQQQSV